MKKLSLTVLAGLVIGISFDASAPADIQQPDTALSQNMSDSMYIAGYGGMQMSNAIVDSVSPGQTKSHEINIDKTEQMSVTCFTNGYLRLAMTDPNGVRIDSAATRGDQTSAYVSAETEEGQNIISVILGDNPPAGKWIIEVSSDKANNKAAYYMLMTQSQGSDINLEAKTEKDYYFKGDTILIMASLLDKFGPVTGAKVEALAWQTRERTDTLYLYDDGAHGDSLSDDGLYANRYPFESKTGFLTFSIKATGEGEKPFTRYGSTMANIARSRAKLNGIFSDYGRDTDGDQLFDELIVEAGINVIDPDTFWFGAQLRVPDGPHGKPAPGDEYIASFLGSFSADTFLTAGEHKLLIAFDGEHLYEKHHDGPYQFEQLSVYLFDISGSQGVDRYDGIYLTKKYSYWDFQGAGILLDGEYSDRSLDINGDGLYDSLIVSLNIDIRSSDTYVWQSTLFGDRAGQGLDNTMAECFLKKGVNTIRFSFKGSKLRAGGLDGPYEMTGIAIYGKATGASIVDMKKIMTHSYKYTQFE
ncbi:MAG TPA: hypothetical protein DEO84_01035 [candidate division Zixibacteria bacterium]|nr:hypothetical protein [candidate division Zixibacteria bacterium]